MANLRAERSYKDPEEQGLQKRCEQGPNENMVRQDGGPTGRDRSANVRRPPKVEAKNDIENEGFNEETLIRMMMGNARSLASENKLEMTTSIANLNQDDVLIFWETGMRDNNILEIPGYRRICHAAKPGLGPPTFSGVGMWIKEHLDIVVKNRKKITETHFQAINVETNLFKIIAFYRSPSSDKRSDQIIRKYFDEEAKLDTILVGDLNLPDVEWEEEELEKSDGIKNIIARTLLSNFRKQWVTFSTRKENLLDIVVGHKDLKIECYKQSIKPEKLDHEWLGLDLLVQEEKVIETKSYKKTVIEWDRINQVLEKVLWLEEDTTFGLTSVENLIRRTEQLVKIIREVIKENTVEKEVKIVSEAEKRKRKIEQLKRVVKLRKRKNEGVREKEDYLKQKKILDKLHWEEVLEKEKTTLRKLNEDPGYVFKLMDNDIKDKVNALHDKEGILRNDPKEVAEIYAEFIAKQLNPEKVSTVDWSKETNNLTNNIRLREFRTDEKSIKKACAEMKKKKTLDPLGMSTFSIGKIIDKIAPQLTSIANQSFRLGYVPNILKGIHICPIPKTGKNKQFVQNVRPINLTPILLKLIERVVKPLLVKFLEEQQRLNDAQDGFRPNRSCTTTLTKISQKLQMNMAKGQRTLVLLMDFSQAFDKVPFDQMMIQTYKMGITNMAGRWLQSWLYNNEFQVRMEDQLSDKRPLTSSIKQGSVIAPILFTIFIEGLTEALLETGIERGSFFFFADDLTIVRTVEKEEDIMKLQRLLTTSEKWSETSLLKFNEKKCNYLLIGDIRKERDYNLVLYGTKLEKTSSAKLLGLTLNGETKDIFKTARQKARQWFQLVYLKIRKIFTKTRYKFINIVYNSYFLSGALYGSEIFSNYTPDFEEFNDTKPPYLKKANNLYKRLFSGKKPDKKEKCKNAEQLSPMFPSQIVILKDLVLIYQILSGESIIDSEQILGTFKAHPTNRSAKQSKLCNSLKAPKRHVDFLSLVKKYENLLMKAENERSHPLHKLELLGGKERKKVIIRFINGQDCQENLIRKQIFEGSYVYKPKGRKL